MHNIKDTYLRRPLFSSGISYSAILSLSKNNQVLFEMFHYLQKLKSCDFDHKEIVSLKAYKVLG